MTCRPTRFAVLAFAAAILLAFSGSPAHAVPFTLNNDGVHGISAFDLTSGGSDNQLNNSNETLTIWDAIDLGATVPGLVDPAPAGNPTYQVGAYETDTETVVNYAGGGDFGGNIALNTIGGGTIPFSGDSQVQDISVRAVTYLAVPVGTWSIAIASDDGRRLEMPGLSALTTPNFIAHGGQIDGGSGTGFDFLLRNGTTGHNRSVGVFTVGAGDVAAGSNVALLGLDGFYFERGTGGGSFEISIKGGSDTGFGGPGDGWVLLSQGTFGWSISSTPIVVTVATDLGSRTWHDASTGNWTTTNWDTGAPPPSGTNSGVHFLSMS